MPRQLSEVKKRELETTLAAYIKCMEKNAASMRNVPMPELNEQLFSLFETTGNRLLYENVYFQRRKYLSVYGCLTILRENPDDAAKLEEVIRGICEEECWALPAHVDRVKNPAWRRTVDLFAAETGQALAEILALAGDRLNPEIRELVRENVLDRVLLPFLESEAPYSFWERGENNWNAVCAGSIGCAAIYLLSGEPELLENLIGRIVDSLHYYIDGFADDGACLEGLGYFSYGFYYYVGFAELLCRYTKGKIDLLNQEKVCRIALFQQKCYFPSGRTLSFSDANSEDKYRLGLTCLLALRYPEVELPPVACAGGFETDRCYRFLANYRDVIWTRRYLEEHSVKFCWADEEQENVTPICESVWCWQSRYIVLPDAQWSIARGASGGGMACKGGTNGEPHNHNDVGSFLYLQGNEMLLADLGTGEYTKAYFSENGRYQILCNRSLGHNVPVVDGKEQQAGVQYCCDSFESDGRGRTVIHYASAYGNSAVRDLIRTLEYDAASERLVVEDVLKTDSAMPECEKENRCARVSVTMRENLITEYLPEIEAETIVIKGKEHACRITVEGATGPITAEEKSHIDHRGNRRTVYCLSWETPMGGCGERRCRFLVEPS
ncbi:MAG: heparinase II/III-family protein [Lachnospiraceae bacterium]|nr:heparinase II/III-family protein [Lachnospiraceae bacterium]